jgi:hypothetical protein
VSKQRQFPELRSIFDKNREVVKMLKAEKQIDQNELFFRAVYNKLGRKIAETKDNPSMSSFTSVINGRYQVCDPDSITITWHHNSNEQKLFEQTFAISKEKAQSQGEENVEVKAKGLNGFQGFGEAEVNQIVEKRLTDLRRVEDYERMKDEHQSLHQKIKELQLTNEELEKDKTAKETTESYMRIIGMALPGLSKFFGGASLLSMLAGTDEEPENKSLAAAKEPSDEREEMIHLLYDFMMGELNEQEVATVYMLFMEIQKDKTQLQHLLNQITKGNSNATTLQK